MSKHSITMEFDSPELADLFFSWLCNSGEQGFFDFMELYTDKSLCFDYHNSREKNGETEYGEFLASGKVQVWLDDE